MSQFVKEAGALVKHGPLNTPPTNIPIDGPEREPGLFAPVDGPGARDERPEFMRKLRGTPEGVVLGVVTDEGITLI